MVDQFGKEAVYTKGIGMNGEKARLSILSYKHLSLKYLDVKNAKGSRKNLQKFIFIHYLLIITA